MIHIPPPGTLFYRVTEAGRAWREVLSGLGSYFSSGGRYHRAHQRTVYTAVDPLVAISETAFHQAVKWQLDIGRGLLSSPQSPSPPPLPLLSEHELWCFTLANRPSLIDVEDAAALLLFRHRLYELLNPSIAYRTTADLADAIRQHPDPHHPTADGILTASVRTPASPGYKPRQHVLFVPANQLVIPGTLKKKWRLTLEFSDNRGQSVMAHTRVIDWVRPWFRLSRSRSAVPAYPERSRARPFPPRICHRLTLAYA